MTDSILLIDNYDSFTYNLVHSIEACGSKVEVWRNDEFEIHDVNEFKNIVLSPGPGIPDGAGLLKEIISQYHKTKRILGICLGQQAIAEVFGGKLRNLQSLYHGVSDQIEILVDDEPMFKGVPNGFSAGRYHSWTVDKQLPSDLEITSKDINGEIMSLRHKIYDVRGVQFHPESIMTPFGRQMLSNWLDAR